MKFKERRGNVFVFDGGYDSEELEVLGLANGFFVYSGIYLDKDSNVCTFDEVAKYKDIQTAVNLMTILKDKGLV